MTANDASALSQAFTPLRPGRLTLSNRLVMAPMTRSRAKSDGTPGDLAAAYYSQRAGVGLIVGEGTQPSDDGQGYLTTPGSYTPAHIAGWKQVTAATEERGRSRLLSDAGGMASPEDQPRRYRQYGFAQCLAELQAAALAGALDIQGGHRRDDKAACRGRPRTRHPGEFDFAGPGRNQPDARLPATMATAGSGMAARRRAAAFAASSISPTTA